MLESDKLTLQKALKDELALEELIKENKFFILRCCSDTCNRYINTSDDEWSVGLSAFHKAVKSFDDNKGDFHPFAGRVIRNSLIDYMRTKKGKEISVSPQAFESSVNEDSSLLDFSVNQIITEKSLEINNSGDITEEIDSANSSFSAFGFTFWELAASSPKSKKTKEACKKAVLCIMENPSLAKSLKKSHVLPLKEIENISKVPRKILERHRKYIIAAIELISGDYPHLAEYLQFITKGDEHQ
ncbi:MAG: sigma factor [Oscillospiraceae bacterium]